jgi:hypothetical protein
MSNFAITSANLSVEFTRRGDRFAHRVLAADADDWVGLLESLEGAADDDWPASPPWQEVHCEQRVGGVQVALAVGKAGKSHWSASFELDAAGSLTVDVACRAAAAPRRLCSTYLLHGPFAIEAPHGAARLAGRWLLQPGADEAASRIELGDSARSWSIGPMFDPAGDWPRTIRWKYLLRAVGE